MVNLNSKLKSVITIGFIFVIANISVLITTTTKVDAILNCSASEIASAACPVNAQQICPILKAKGCVPMDAVCISGGCSGPICYAANLGNGLINGVDQQCLYEATNQARVNGDYRALAMTLESSNPGLLANVLSLNNELLKQRPLSGVDFIESKVYALTHPGQVRAQDEEGYTGLYYRGTGFDLLKPVQAFWGWSVNIVYGLLIFIIIGVAFAIMFRGKLGGSAEVTIQTAIPNIALAMILVPLSYAISGFIIDGMTIGLNVSHEFLLGPGSPGSKTYETRKEEYPCSRYLGVGAGPADDCEDRGLHADDVRVSWIYAGSNINAGQDLSGFVQSVFFTLGITNTANSLPGWADGMIALFVNLFIGIVLLLTGLRIFWYLMNKFLIFIIMPMFAPFYFATIAIPGQGIKSAMMYVKLLGSGSIAYVVAYTMTILSLIFASTAFKSQLAGLGFSTFVPPMTGFEAILSNAGGTQVPSNFLDFYTTLIALGIYLLIPVFLKKVDQTLGTENMLPAFITDAVQSAKDSINLGKQGVATFRSGLNATGRLARSSTIGAISSIQKNVFGIGEGDYRHVGNVIGRGVRGFTSGLASAADNVNVPILREAAQMAARAANQAVGGAANMAAGRNISGTGAGTDKAGEGGGLEAEFSWNAGGNVINIDDKWLTEAEYAITQAVNAGSDFAVMQGPAVTLKATGEFLLPARINATNLRVASTEGEGQYTQSSKMRRGAAPSLGIDLLGNLLSTRRLGDTALRAMRTGGGIFFFGKPATAGRPGNWWAVVSFQADEYSPDNAGKASKMSCEFILDLDEISGGNATNATAIMEGLMRTLARQFHQSTDAAFRIGFNESPGIKVRIDSSFVNNGNRVSFNTTTNI